LGDTSLDNFGSIVTSCMSGREEGKKVPDFMEHKATTSISNDTLIALILEVSELMASSQMAEYIWEGPRPKGTRLLSSWGSWC
jgi:hypothetical protein